MIGRKVLLIKREREIERLARFNFWIFSIKATTQVGEIIFLRMKIS